MRYANNGSCEMWRIGGIANLIGDHRKLSPAFW